jgi:3-oxoacyl-[acyl-carrier protein] reductase
LTSAGINPDPFCMTLTGKTALVTGGGRGIGRAIALRLAREGAAVGVNYRERAKDAEAVVAQIRDSGGHALAVGADVGDARAAQAMVEKVAREFGPVTILVNNAGVSRRGNLMSFDFSLMEGMQRTNVDGLVYVTRTVVPGMQSAHFGRIVNISSIAAHGTTTADTTFYAATKAAVSVLTRRFALEFGEYGITVNAVAPGYIATEILFSGRTPEQVAALNERMVANTMVRRIGATEDIAHAVAFLVSPEASFVTAQVITVDGGRMDYIGHP